MVSYHITEPHPSTPAPTIYYGRGGAGNVTRVPKNITSGQDASGPASRIKLSPPPSNALFTSGRGGAGNIHREKERAMFSFDQELVQQERLREHAAPVYHIGRGGAGNLVEERQKTSRQNFIGTPEAVAAAMDEFVQTDASDGFVLVPHITPGGLDEFADTVVPLLQERGSFRTEYTGTTLREHLGLRPPS